MLEFSYLSCGDNRHILEYKTRALKPPVDTNFCSFNIIKIIHPRRTQTCFKSRLNVHNPLRSSLATVSVMYIELFLFHSVINTSYVCSDMLSK